MTMAAARDALRLLCMAANRASALRLIATTLTIMAASALSAAAPLALKHLVDALSAPGRPSTLAAAGTAGALYAVATTGSRVLAEIRPWLMGAVEQQLSAAVRSQAFAHLMRLPLAFHLGQKSGTLTQAINQATVASRMILVAVVGSVLPVLVELGVVMVILVQLTEPWLVACILLSSLVHLVLLALTGPALSARSGEVVQASLRTHGLLAECLGNVESIKCNGAAGHMGHRLAVFTDEEQHHWSMLHQQRVRMGVASAVAFGSGVAACLFLSAHAVAAGTLTLGGFVLASLYVIQITRPLESLGAGIRDLVQAVACFRPLLEILRTPPEGRRLELRTQDPCSRRSATPSDRTAPSLVFENITFAHVPGRTALSAISFHIQPGRTLAIVGPSGSGKSSLIRLILGLHDAQQGRILLDGVCLEALEPDHVRAMTGFVPQETVLFNDTIAANIKLGAPDAGPSAVIEAARLAGLADLIASLPAGSDTLVGDRGLKLSGGERQRVAIARAALRKPRLYLFDEATSMLDSATEAAVMRNILAVGAGCTTVIVAHRLSTVAHADEILVLDRGTIVERGTHDRLLEAGRLYARMWQAQQPGRGSHGRLKPA